MSVDQFPNPDRHHSSRLHGPTARRRVGHRSPGLVDPGASAELAELLADERFAFLDTASRQLSACEECADEPIGLLNFSSDPEAVALAAATEWLAARRPTSAPARLPPWLVGLESGELLGAARRREGPGRAHVSYLLEMRLPGQHVGTLQARVDTSSGGRLINAFVTDDPLDQLATMIKAVSRTRTRSAVAVETYRPIMSKTARRALSAALAISDSSSTAVEPGSPWPALRPFVSFALGAFCDSDREPSSGG